MLRPLAWSLFIVGLCIHSVAAQSVFPGADWDVATAASQGMDAEGLEKAKVWLESHKFIRCRQVSQSPQLEKAKVWLESHNSKSGVVRN